MSTEPDEITADAAAWPSAEFINAISRFFETDPSDLLTEMGYYERPEMESALPEMTAAQE